MARIETSFYVVNDTTECAVLYRKADRYLCAPFDREKKEVEPAFRLLYYQDNQNVELRKEDIGPLHLKPTPTPTPKPTLTPTVTRTPPPTAILTSTAEIPRFKD